MNKEIIKEFLASYKPQKNGRILVQLKNLSGDFFNFLVNKGEIKNENKKSLIDSFIDTELSFFFFLLLLDCPPTVTLTNILQDFYAFVKREVNNDNNKDKSR